MQYFLPMRKTSFEKARASAWRAVRRFPALRLASRTPRRWQAPDIGRLLYETTVPLWWAAITRRVHLAWSDFHSLTTLEQGCWAFLTVVSAVCLTLRMLRSWGF
jgi:hypothetical protein